MLTEELPSAVVAKVKGKAKRKQGKRYGHITYQPIHCYQGESYPIQTYQSSGCYTEPLNQMIKRIVGAVEHYKRVMFVRFDLSMGDYEATSERLSAFLKLASRYVARAYQARFEFAWCREQKKAKRQHYHLIALIDGDKLRHPDRLFDELAEIWGRKGGRLSIPKNSYQMVKRHNLANAIYRASYLAKERDKGNRPNGVRDFGYSQFKA